MFVILKNSKLKIKKEVDFFRRKVGKFNNHSILKENFVAK
jgi:hypothetical protein